MVRPIHPLATALEKVYIIKSQATTAGVCYFPKCLVGKRVKL